MISRRLLRIKVLLVLYAYFKTEGKSIRDSEKELKLSVQKTYDLYHYLLALLISVIDYEESRQELGRKKKLPSPEDLNPNTKFIRNKVIQQLKDNIQLNSYLKNNITTSISNDLVIKTLHKEIVSSDIYQKYMSESNGSYDEDKELVLNIYEGIILNNEILEQTLEENSIYWNDDLDYVIGMVVKTIQKLESGSTEYFSLLPMYKNVDDGAFALELMSKTIIHKIEDRNLINEFAQNWEIDRIAFIDIIIMQLAITELTVFPSIPIKVTFNEYIEMAKYYSTAQSSTFINGILDKMLVKLKEENRINKTGRGLIDN